MVRYVDELSFTEGFLMIKCNSPGDIAEAVIHSQYITKKEGAKCGTLKFLFSFSPCLLAVIYQPSRYLIHPHPSQIRSTAPSRRTHAHRITTHTSYPTFSSKTTIKYLPARGKTNTTEMPTIINIVKKVDHLCTLPLSLSLSVCPKDALQYSF